MIKFSGSENINNLIKLEEFSIESELSIQGSFNNQILIFINKIMSNTVFSPAPDNKIFLYLNLSTYVLNKSNFNISILKKLVKMLSSLNINDPFLEESIKKYNLYFNENMNKIYKNTRSIEKFTHVINVTDFDELPNYSEEVNLQLNKTIIQPQQNNTKEVELPKKQKVTAEESVNSDEASYLERTLIISEEQKKVILPYTLEEIKELIIENDSYTTIDEVIEEYYTRPLKNYKYASLSRFKEAYNLVKKENGSKLKAFALAFELFGNYNLHPAIISACKTLDELDIYLACLEENSLQDFKFFNIKFEITPINYKK